MKLLILALTVSAAYASTFHVGFDFKASQEKRQLYSSKLLHHVQLSGIFPDSKTFVDMRMKRNEKTILLAFDELLAMTHERPTKEQLADFINYNFDSESGLEPWRPSDFVSEPSFLNSIKDSQFKLFARNVYSILLTLGRKIKPIVFRNPEQFSVIPVHNGFIVPGGNSKEFNYMESYWIIESLLISGMKETAKGMISNLIELQREFGYIPSGYRYYYLGRSQPPLLSAMMAIYIQETNDIEFLRANINAIEGELEYWLDTHSVVFQVAGREHSLLRYITNCRGPRPEEYYQDFTNAQVFDNDQRQEQFYTDMKAAGESGWVLSSRWIMNKNGSNLGDLSLMHTTEIVPVDLNAIFANAVQNVVQFYSVLNDARRGAHWLEIRKRWVNSMKEVLWNEEESMWFDWDLSSSQHRKYFYTSNLSPLWMGVVEPEFIKAKSQLILNYLRKTHSLEYPGGVPASLIKSGYLYDLPYAWPAQVSIVVSALEALQTEESSRLAFEVAQNLVRSMYKAYQTDKQLYAKYDVETPGKPLVASGEYLDEEAFGGTIGVIIETLAKYGATMTSVSGDLPFPSKFDQYSQLYSTSAPQIVNYQYSGFPAKPKPVVVAKPESPIKPDYINDYKKPSFAPTYFAQTTYLPSEPTKPTLAEVKPEHIVYIEEKPGVTTLKDEAYISTTYKPEYITYAPIKPYQPIPTKSKLEVAPTVYNKPSYTTFTQKPTLVTEVKPDVVPTVSKPSYTTFTPVQPSLLTEAKPEVAPTVYPAKPVYTSYVFKPQYFSTVKPTYVAPVKPATTLQANIKFELPSSKPSYAAPLPQKPEYLSVEAKPEPQLLEKKPEYLPVVPVPQKPEYLPVAPVPQNLEYLPVAPVPQKPEYFHVAPVPQKPEYLPVAPVQQKPGYLPAVPVPQKPEYLPVAPAPPKPEYGIAEAKPEHQLFEKKPESFPVAAVPLKHEYISVETKPEHQFIEKKPEGFPVAPAPLKHEYISVETKPEHQLFEKKPESFPVAPVPLKHEYISVETKPGHQLFEKKPESFPVAAVPLKHEYISVETKPEHQSIKKKPVSFHVAPVPLKHEYISVETKPEHQFFEKKPEGFPVAPAPLKHEYISVETKPEQQFFEKKPDGFPVAPAPLKHEYISVETKPEHQFFEKKPLSFPVAPAPLKHEYISVETKPEHQLFEKKPVRFSVAPVPVKHEYISVEAKPEPELLEKKPELPVKPLAPVPQLPEYLPVVPVPQKPEYLHVAAVPQKPLYVSVQAKPESHLLEKKPESVSAAEAKPEIFSTIYSKPLYPTYPTPAPVKPTFVIEAKPEVAHSRYPTKPLYSMPVQTSYVAPLSLKPEYTSVEAKPESQLLEKKPEYVTDKAEEIVLSTTSEPVYVSTTAQPEQVTPYPAKPEQVTLHPPKPEQVFYPAKPAQVSSYPTKPTFSSFPSWFKYTTSVKAPIVSAVKPLDNVQAKPEYSSTIEFQSEKISTTLAPKYEATITSKPEQFYAAKPINVASLPIKHEYTHSIASLPAKEVNIQTSPVKPAYGSQTIYVSSAKPFFAPTKPSLIASLPVQAVSQQVSYTSSSYRQPDYLVPALSESKYPASAEYESSTVVEPEYTTLAAGEYITYKPEYITVAESEYPSTTIQSEFEYASTESQLVDATVKPQYGYLSVQSKPQATAFAVSGSVSTDKKPYFAGYSTFSSQKQEGPNAQTTYVSSVQSQASGVAELTPAVSVSIPAKQLVDQGEIASQDQATVLQQSHFSYFDKPARVPAAVPVVVATLPSETAGFSSFTKLNINSGNVTKVDSSSTNTHVSSKPQLSFGTFGSGYTFNKTVTPSFITSTVNVSGVPLKNNQKLPQSGQYVSSSSYNKPFNYNSKPNRNTYSSPGQYQDQYQGQYQAQYNSGAYNSGRYKPTISSATAKHLVSSTTVKSFPVSQLALAG